MQEKKSRNFKKNSVVLYPIFIHTLISIYHLNQVFIWTEFDEIESEKKCKEGYPGVGHEYTLCRDVCKRDLPITGEISNASHVSLTHIGIFFAMFLTLFL